MTILALDVGDRRIGVAVSDPTELLARPLLVFARKSNLIDCGEIARIVATHDARTIVVGLPLLADDRVGDQGRHTLAFARFLRRHVGVPVVNWDERYSTIEAERRMVAQGIGKARRPAAIDAAAAAVILEEWLTHQRSSRGELATPPPPNVGTESV